MRELGRRFPQVKLALSLHAAREELRSELVPLNRTYPLRDVLKALKSHCDRTGKLATVEYVILPGVNNSRRDAEALVRALEGIPCRINLLGFNPFAGAPYGKPSVEQVLRFRRWLSHSFPRPVTIRRSRGADIQGACGQLRLERQGQTRGTQKKPRAWRAKPRASSGKKREKL
jgi:23S rRNA (adenine2503-C2)-methyltransferase